VPAQQTYTGQLSRDRDAATTFGVSAILGGYERRRRRPEGQPAPAAARDDREGRERHAYSDRLASLLRIDGAIVPLKLSPLSPIETKQLRYSVDGEEPV